MEFQNLVCGQVTPYGNLDNGLALQKKINACDEIDNGLFFGSIFSSIAFFVIFCLIFFMVVFETLAIFEISLVVYDLFSASP